jgi:hypothetical protein
MLNRHFILINFQQISLRNNSFGGLYINSDGSKWNCFSQKKGGGAIQFAMFMRNISWVEAVKELLNIGSDCISTVKQYNYKSEPSKKPLQLPDKNNTFKHITAYLAGTRKIDKEIVRQMIKQKKIYEDKHGSVCFVGYDKQGIPKYTSIRSTNIVGNPYKRDVKNSDKAYPFAVEGKGNNVCIFESPIDLMSYLTLLKMYDIKDSGSHYISLGGVSDKALEWYLKENPQISSVTICVDNDPAGKRACKDIKAKYEENYAVKVHSPHGKDFNEDLAAIKELELAQKSNENGILTEEEDEAII